MCRFLLVKSRTSFAAAPWLESFADMAKDSRAPDGDRQADGWGATWIEPDGRWHFLSSLAPVWTERTAFRDVPSSRFLVVHARSASFPGQTGVLEYCQPFVGGRYAFVFNGLLRGVSLPPGPAGAIGSQRIWALIRGLLDRKTPADSLRILAGILERRAKEISALNIGLCDGERIFAYSKFEIHPEYYRLHAATSPGWTAVCSEPLAGCDFRPVRTREALTF
jgi:predicted glutamine amidotransferase